MAIFDQQIFWAFFIIASQVGIAVPMVAIILYVTLAYTGSSHKSDDTSDGRAASSDTVCQNAHAQQVLNRTCESKWIECVND